MLRAPRPKAAPTQPAPLVQAIVGQGPWRTSIVAPRAYQVRRWAWVLYSGEAGGRRLWHQRLVHGVVEFSGIATASELCLAVTTPDGDTYCEDASDASRDVSAVRFCANRAERPAGVGANEVYRFGREPSARELAQWESEASASAIEVYLDWCQADGKTAGAGQGFLAFDAPVIAAVPAGQSGAAVARGSWVAAESGRGMKRGESLAVQPAFSLQDCGVFEINDGPVVGRRVLATDLVVYQGAEAVEDARLLGIRFREGIDPPERHIGIWRDLIEDMDETPFKEWNVPGPRTVAWCCRFINRKAGGALDHHRSFRETFRLRKGDWGLDIHELALRTLEHLVTFDYLNVPNLSGAEDLARAAQLVEYVYHQESSVSDAGKGKGKGRAGVIDEAHIFTGAHRDSGEVMISPDLLEYVSKEVERDASIMKQIRKGREERAAASKNRGNKDKDADK